MTWPTYLLQRHPLEVTAHFVYSLVLTYAFPAAELAPMLPPALTLDTFENHAFVAVALVQTEGLRPAGVPRRLGQNFFLAGYRIFTRFRPEAGRTLRGLYILRSDTDRRLMAAAGNLLTHYRYRVSHVETQRAGQELTCRIESTGHEADLHITARLDAAEVLPDTTPFSSVHEARRFAGPLPFTFDDEPETQSIIVIKGERAHWRPRVVPVTVHAATFFEHGAFAGLHGRLASAFFVEEIDYRWKRGVRHALAE